MAEELKLPLKKRYALLKVLKAGRDNDIFGRDGGYAKMEQVFRIKEENQDKFLKAFSLTEEESVSTRKFDIEKNSHLKINQSKIAFAKEELLQKYDKTDYFCFTSEEFKKLSEEESETLWQNSDIFCGCPKAGLLLVTMKEKRG